VPQLVEAREILVAERAAGEKAGRELGIAEFPVTATPDRTRLPSLVTVGEPRRQ